MTTTKKHIASRFMKLYKLFRRKKYGEPMDGDSVWKLEEEEDPFTKDQMPSPMKEVRDEINSKLSEIEKYLCVGDKK